MKRGAPMKRTAFDRPEHPQAKEAKPVKAPKERQCSAPNCEATFEQRRMEHVYCSPRCLIAGRKAAEKAERAETKGRKEALKRIPDLIREAQTAFNAWVRYRDKDQPCICCGRIASDGDLLTGSRWDAGHYRSTGSASHLRFHEDNCHRQLVRCNRHGAGRAVDYRIGLIARIGLARVEALEADNTAHKWTREELIAIRAAYKKKLKELEKA